MVKDYNFEEIKKYLKKDSEIGQDVLDAFDSLADAAIIFSPIVFGPEMLPLLNLLDVKDRLMNLGRKVCTAISKRIETDYITRSKQIKAAYALICYTAYFDALQSTLPSKIIKKLKLKIQEKNKLLENVDGNFDNTTTTLTSSIHCNVFYADHVTSLESIKSQLLDLYTGITDRITKMIMESSILDAENSKDVQLIKELNQKLSKLPEKSVEIYEAQYLYLADNFSDFALFAQMESFDRIQHTANKNEKALQLLTSMTNKIDIGLSNLNEIVNSLPSNYVKIQSQSIVDELRCKYIGMINEPIIKDEEIKNDQEMELDADAIKLKFPKIVDAFIPQSYKCLLYKQKGTKLENNSIWEDICPRNDIDKFFVKYLYSLDSIDYPLIVLGQPGSGKSLLTKVLSAQLMSNSYTVIRIPLRDVNADDSIDILVEDQIRKMINRPLSAEGYGGFASQFNEKPLIIILDGYDELLQAKGSVFSSYLEKVRTFQQNQKQLNRPVRIIVTSRITLIDKARIPINSTILRLMEFNENQREEWIKVWNDTNSEYFSNYNIQPFSLLEHEKEGRNNIIELAEQPLLLLMLALYDSEKNELAKTSSIKRTELYDNLLRRFVRRERSRYVLGFEGKTPREQEIIIDGEMNRLGVIAIGMYNRRDVVIRSEQLEKDLDAFNAHRKNENQENRTLTDAESVLGGFFFIHKSTAKDTDANNDNTTSAYEFLHNTFGEFLAADFILRNTIIEIKDVYIDRKYKSSDSNNSFLRLSPESLKSFWFYCLMFVPLYSRPVVVEMLREHATKAFNHYLDLYSSDVKMSNIDYEDNLKYIIQNQLKMILNTRNCPKVMQNGTLFDNDMPLLGYLATYTLNLIILVSAINPNGFDFFEDEYRKIENNELDLNPWDKLTSLWKSWFAPADLVGLSVVLRAIKKDKTCISIKCHKKFEATRYEQPIDILLCISTTLADTLLMSLSGIQTTKFQEITRSDLFSIKEILKKEHFDLFIKYLISLLRREIFIISNNDIFERQFDAYRKVNYLIYELLSDRRIVKINFDTRIELFEIFEVCLSKKILFFRNRRKFLRFLPKLIEKHLHEEKFHRDNRSIIVFNRLFNLVVPNHNYLLRNRKLMYSEMRYKNTVFGEVWAEDLDRIIQIALRYKDIEILENSESTSYLISILNIMNLSTPKGSQRYLDFIEHMLIPENVEDIMEADPEGFSYALLDFIKKIGFKSIKSSLIIEAFFEKLFELIFSVGIGYLGLETIINAVEIAKYTKSNNNLNRTKKILNDLFCTMSTESMVFFVYNYPEIIEKLIVLIPEVFYQTSFMNIENLLFEINIHYFVDNKKFINYIKFVRSLQFFLKDKYSSESKYTKYLCDLTKSINRLIDLSGLEISKLSLEQADDLLWCLSYSDNHQLRDEVVQIVNKCSFLKESLKYD